MTRFGYIIGACAVAILLAITMAGVNQSRLLMMRVGPDLPRTAAVSQPNVTHDKSPALVVLNPRAVVHREAGASEPDVTGIDALEPARLEGDADEPPVDPDLAAQAPPALPVPEGAARVEQTTHGEKPAAQVVESFDGLGSGFSGPQGAARLGNPSDNSLAVGRDHIVQIVNSRMAIFSKKGRQYLLTGQVLYGPVVTNTIFKGFGGACENQVSGDAVVRYDQLADRWLFVLPVFRRGAPTAEPIPAGEAGKGAQPSVAGQRGQPGPATPLFVPPPPPPVDPNAPTAPAGAPGTRGRGAGEPAPTGPFSMCYAVSTSADPMGSYYRYEFLRPLFPDYPRPAIWPDGYYVPTSTSDNRISETVATQKHACVADRQRMLRGEPATEQCVVVENTNFLNNADLDGHELPPAGAPNILVAAGGRQLDKIFEDHVLQVWQFHVDWKNPANTALVGPQAIEVAPYHYLCDGQLTPCVPQPGTDHRLDAQGDKIMARLVYRKVNGHESLVAVHSVNTSAGAGGVRWYELRVGGDRTVTLHQQGTYAPDESFRWMASPAIDRLGNIGIGFSHGGSPDFPGQRFAGRQPNDPLGRLTLKETTLVAGEAADSSGRLATQRWEDYTQTAIDPVDDCTVWYVGDYVKKGNSSYTSRIGAFRMPGCGR